MLESTSHPLDYYARPGLLTDPEVYAGWLDDLPRDIPSLVKVVQGLMVHIFWAERYGLNLSEERKQEVQLRTVSKMLARIVELDDRPLSEPRALEDKLIGNCRDFTVLLCAILRHQGTPARARCGFGRYFLPGHYEDHWVGEYWNAGQQRWLLVDAQLDPLQREVLKIQFDPLDVPRDQFVTGGKAWQLCRSGAANPDHFGIFDMHGLPFVLGDLIRDFLAFNKIEILPWDGWGLMVGLNEAIPDHDLPLIDRLADLTLRGNEVFDEVRALYESEARLHTLPEWLLPQAVVE
jgi:hypothetical protein